MKTKLLIKSWLFEILPPYTNYLLWNTAHIEALLHLRQGFPYEYLLALNRALITYHFQNTYLLWQVERSRLKKFFLPLLFQSPYPPSLLNQADIFSHLVRFDVIMVKLPQLVTIFALTWFEQLQPSQLYHFRCVLKITRLWFKKIKKEGILSKSNW